MNIKTHGDNLFGETPTPCFLADFNTDEIVYMNPAMKIMLEFLGPPNKFFGKKYYDIITNRGKTCSLCHSKSEWESTNLIEHQIYNEFFAKHFKVTHVLVNLFGVNYNLSKYFEVETTTAGTLSFEEAMTKCISIFQQPKHTITEDFMVLLCEFYQCQRAYVYYINYDNNTINCATQWCRDKNYTLPPELGKKIDPNKLLAWFHTKNEVGIVEANPTLHNFNATPFHQELLDVFQLENLTMSVIEDADHHILGVVGLSNRANIPFNYRLLDAVTRFISQDLNNKTALDVALTLMNSKDALTGFHSRDIYSKYMDQVNQSSPKSMGVIFVNVNGLKQINVEAGFTRGDSHIQDSAKLLKENFGFDFYRISGNEFVGVAPDISKEEFENVVNAHHKIMKDTENYSFALGHSWSDGSFNFLKLVQDADTVMYINKQEYYHSTKQSYDQVHNSILSDLLTFLENDEFLVYLQPQVSLKDGSVIGAEALVRRFDKSNQKMVFPDQFIPLYEKNSIVRHVDLFVLDKVCQLLSTWGNYGRQIPISINLSRVTLLEHGIVDTVCKICQKYNINHNYLMLEVTERVGLIENDVAATLIDQFHQEGFKVSLDDFGCAYSNIVTLAKVSVNEVKIDKSIVDDLNHNAKNRIIAKNILTMCNELDNTETLAEGIEHESQAIILKDFGCTMGQGYLYARPMPHEEFFEKYIKNNNIPS